MQKYNSIIAVIERRMGKSTTTDNVELERMGRTLLGAKFKGVYASDGVPALTANTTICCNQQQARVDGG